LITSMSHQGWPFLSIFISIHLYGWHGGKKLIPICSQFCDLVTRIFLLFFQCSLYLLWKIHSVIPLMLFHFPLSIVASYLFSDSNNFKIFFWCLLGNCIIVLTQIL
jgi:hypothetical protein